MENSNYINLFNYILTKTLPIDFSAEQKQQLKRRSKNFTINNNLLYKNNNNTRKPVRVIKTSELEPVLYMFHHDPTAAHASAEKMMDKIKARYYWPQMFEDIRAYVQSCDDCQRRGKSKRTEPLHPIPVGEPFYQIGIDYVGPLPRTEKGNRYIIVAMDYLTKWPEAKAVKEATANETIQFIYEEIITRHGCPGKILTDRGTHFNNKLMKGLMQKFTIEHLLSTPYHPQTNGLVERFNRTLIEAIARMTRKNIKNWDQYIASSLFAYRTSRHSTTKWSPFFLVYGREAKLPVDNFRKEEERSLVTQIEAHVDHTTTVRRLAQKQIEQEQQKQKDRHDKKLLKTKSYQVGDLVLHYRAMLDKQWSGKLEDKWKGPFKVAQIIGNGSYKLCTLEGIPINTPVNGSYLKLYKERKLPYSASKTNGCH